MQQLLFEPKSDWVAPDLNQLPDWSNAKRISFDIESKDPNLKKISAGFYRGDGHVAGYGFAIEGQGSWYLPVRHEGGGNLPLEPTLHYLRDNAARFKGELVGAKLAYDVPWAKTDGIIFKPAFYRDVQVIEPLIDELPMHMALDAICHRRGIDGKYEELLRVGAAAYGLAGKDYKAVKKNLHKLHAKYVGGYCERDCVAPLEVLRSQEKDIEKHDLWNIVNLESKVLPVLLKYQERGVRVDLAKLEQIELWCIAQEREALAIIQRETGIKLDLNMVYTKEALVPVFMKLGIALNPMKVKKSGDIEYQIDKVLLSKYGQLPAVKALSWARKVNRLRCTFAFQVREHLCPDGRIHCTFNQIAMESDEGDEKGARYGRLSCVDPNLQQQPSRDEFAKEWRSIYLPEEGAIWGCHDYSQQEPRWVTHYAASVYIPPGSVLARELRFAGHLSQAAMAAEAYWADPKLDNHTFMAKLTGLKRSDAKLVYLGLCYGEGGAKLCRDLGLPTAWAVHFAGRGTKKFHTMEEAMAAAAASGIKAKWYECAGTEGQVILDTFDQRAPFIRQLANLCKYKAELRGFIRTAGGRMLHFPRRADGTFDWTHKALNRLIQGTSADQVKAAIVAIDEAMPELFLNLQVHDELDGSYESPTQGKKSKKIMQECMGDTKVPWRVDDEYGPNWGYIAEAA
jgi:DNA polymerase I-like protein with 3'-5' exonuclease and polymerase domains